MPDVSPGVGATVIDITGGPDGAVWFADIDGNRIGRITAAGEMTVTNLYVVATYAEELYNSVAQGADAPTARWPLPRAFRDLRHLPHNGSSVVDLTSSIDRSAVTLYIRTSAISA